MERLAYEIKNIHGMHIAPAQRLQELAESFKSSVKIMQDDNEADAKRVFEIMGLGIRNGQTVEIQISGEDETEAKRAIDKFFSENMQSKNI